MSNLLPSKEAQECKAEPHPASQIEPLPDRMVKVGPLDVHRVLPVRGRRLIGPWCFFDRYGPLTFGLAKPMDVAPHPHIGLQTVTWLFSGEIIHNDSLGSQCLVRPGELSLMTAGRGIAHTEETPVENSGELDGAQLWVALPEASRQMAPVYQCTKEQGVVEIPGGRVTAILGELAGAASAGRLFSACVGAEIGVHAGESVHLPLDKSFEYAVLLASNDAIVFDTPLQHNTLYYLGTGIGELGIASRNGARLILIGGAPFGEKILMWWNFVVRTSEEIDAARQSWQKHEVFGEVPGYQGQRLTAPDFIGRPVPIK